MYSLFVFFISPLYIFSWICLASCICKFYQNYLLYMFYPWVTFFICHVLFYGLNSCLNKNICFIFDQTYICLEDCLVFDEKRIFHVLWFHVHEKKIFMCFDEIETHWFISMYMFLTWFLYTRYIFCLPMILIHELICAS